MSIFSRNNDWYSIPSCCGSATIWLGAISIWMTILAHSNPDLVIMPSLYMLQSPLCGANNWAFILPVVSSIVYCHVAPPIGFLFLSCIQHSLSLCGATYWMFIPPVVQPPLPALYDCSPRSSGGSFLGCTCTWASRMRMWTASTWWSRTSHRNQIYKEKINVTQYEYNHRTSHHNQTCNKETQMLHSMFTTTAFNSMHILGNFIMFRILEYPY